MSIRGRLSARGHFGREPLGSGAMAQTDSIPCQLALAYPIFMTFAPMLHKTLLKKKKKKNKTRNLMHPKTCGETIARKPIPCPTLK